MFRNLKNKIVKTIANIPGWHTNRKIVVIESDDWGSIRMPSKRIYEQLVKKGFSIENDPYCRFDSLERNIDLENLYHLLSKHKDFKGNTPVFTALCLVANPDFDKIQKENFTNYYYETVNDTLKQYDGRENILNLWREGKKNKIFEPQFHGREHLNVQRWMRDLKQGNDHTLLAFDHRLWGVYSPIIHTEYQAAFDIEFPEDIDYLHTVLEEGIDLFKNILGYQPRFFVPTNGPFNLKLEKTLNDKLIKFILLDKFQKEPLGNGQYKRHLRFLGNKNSYGQVYLSRNCNFEPAQFYEKSVVNKCLKDIELAFNLKKPAVISTHRVNYIGALDEQNAFNSLSQLDELLRLMLKKWPEIEFVTSVELGEIINRNE